MIIKVISYILPLSFLVSFSALTCTYSKSYFEESNSNSFLDWIGNNSEFSKIFIKSKCLLDKELETLSPERKKIIAKLISKSYEYEKITNEYNNF